VSDKKEHLAWLLKKMVEETNEFIENPCYEEAADIFEVLRTLTDLYSLDIEKVHATADDKRVERGGFIQGVILEVVGEHANDYKI
jgi:predicted house-cleaning noncanonical NTP pyrophosphatase (MazG superfamily)